jgi:hypothetical protein
MGIETAINKISKMQNFIGPPIAFNYIINDLGVYANNVTYSSECSVKRMLAELNGCITPF